VARLRAPHEAVESAKIYLTANLNQEQMKAGKSDLVSGDLPRGVLPTCSATLRRAKIICTVGPACDSEAMLRDLMRLGMDVARLNFSTVPIKTMLAIFSDCDVPRKRKAAAFASCRTCKVPKFALEGSRDTIQSCSRTDRESRLHLEMFPALPL